MAVGVAVLMAMAVFVPVAMGLGGDHAQNVIL
jgi:hypothetical protein